MKYIGRHNYFICKFDTNAEVGPIYALTWKRKRKTKSSVQIRFLLTQFVNFRPTPGIVIVGVLR